MFAGLQFAATLAGLEPDRGLELVTYYIEHDLSMNVEIADCVTWNLLSGLLISWRKRKYPCHSASSLTEMPKVAVVSICWNSFLWKTACTSWLRTTSSTVTPPSSRSTVLLGPLMKYVLSTSLAARDDISGVNTPNYWTSANFYVYLEKIYGNASISLFYICGFKFNRLIVCWALQYCINCEVLWNMNLLEKNATISEGVLEICWGKLFNNGVYVDRWFSDKKYPLANRCFVKWIVSMDL